MQVLLILVLLVSGSVFARGFEKSFINVTKDRRLWVEQRAAQNGKPTLVLLNGLTWSTRDWGPFVQDLTAIDPDLGLVLYDMEGQGRTLLDRAPVDWDIPIDLQVDDLRTLLQKLNIKGDVSVAGLSYGGAIALYFSAQHPRIFKQVIAIAPFLERLREQDYIIQTWVNHHKVVYPLDSRSDTELYDHYLRVYVYSTYHLAEPVILENPYHQEAIYRMVKGAKNFTAAAYGRQFPKNAIHVVGAVDDDFVKDENLGAFWKGLPGNRQASYLRVEHTQHKIPALRPEITASWVNQILKGNPDLHRGLIWQVDPYEGNARSGERTIPLNKAGACESLLRAILRFN